MSYYVMLKTFFRAYLTFLEYAECIFEEPQARNIIQMLGNAGFAFSKAICVTCICHS